MTLSLPPQNRGDILAQTLLDDALIELSATIPFVDVTSALEEEGSKGAAAPTGEPFVVIASGGPKKEGDPTPGLFSSAEAAIADWLLHLKAYAERERGPNARLYWRIRPLIDEMTIMRQWWLHGPDNPPGWYEESVFVIYSRLLISSKPVNP